MGALLRFVRAIAMVLCSILLRDFWSAVAPVTVITFALNLVLILCWKEDKRHGKKTDFRQPVDNSSDDKAPFIDQDEVSDEEAEYESSQKRDGSNIHLSMLKSILFRCKSAIHGVYRRYFGRRVFRLAFLVCVIMVFASDVYMIHVQWMAIRYNWSYAATNYVRAYATLVWTCVLAALPWFSSYLLRKMHDIRKVDLCVFRLSLLFKSFGILLEGLAPTKGSFILALTIQALGAGTTDGFKAFLTGFSAKKHTAELYAVTSQVETLVRMFSSRIWAWILIIALKQDHFWMGWPFWLSACVWLCVLPLIQSLANYIESRRVASEQLHEISSRRA